MFTNQVGSLSMLATDARFAHLYGREPDEAWADELLRALEEKQTELIETFQRLLGDCTQKLDHWGQIDFHNQVTHHSTVTFEQDITIEGDIILPDDGTGDAKLLQWGKATADWTNVAGTGKKSYVTCTKIDGDGNAVTGEGAGTVTVYLPRTAQKDPNVRQDDIIGYLMDLDGDAVCITDYLDDKIGTVKHWILTVAGIPPGWKLMNGSANSAGSGKNAGGRVPVCYVEGHPDYGVIGSPGGTSNHTHQPHDAEDINDHFGYETGETELTTNTALVLIAVEPVTFDTLCALAGVTMPDSTIPAELMSPILIDPNPHNHGPGASSPLLYQPGSASQAITTPADYTSLTIPAGQTFYLSFAGIELQEGLCTCAEHTQGHCHALPFHSHSAYSPPHSHYIPPHLHSLPTMDHSGILTHTAEDHRDPWLVTVWIERVN